MRNRKEFTKDSKKAHSPPLSPALFHAPVDIYIHHGRYIYPPGCIYISITMDVYIQ